MNAQVSNSPPLPKLRRWRRRLLRIGLFLTSLIVLFYVEENWRSARAWDRVKASLEARGEPLTIEQYFRQVPEEENFFTAPVVLKQFDKSEPRWLPFKENRNLGEALGAAWEDETKYHLPATLKWLRENATWPLPAETGKVGTDILAVLAPADAGLAEMREAVRRPRSEMLSSQAPPHSSLAGAQFIIETARLYDLRRQALLYEGRTAEACEECFQAIRFARQVSARPVNLMYYLLTCATARVAGATLRDAHGGIPWDETQLQTLETELATLHFADRYTETLRGERVFMLNLLEATPPNSVPAAYLSGLTPPRAVQLFPSGWKQLWIAAMCDAIQQRIEGIAQHGMRGMIGKTLETAWFPPQPFAGKHDPLAGHDSLMQAGMRTETQLHIARVALAAARWRLAKGHLAASLTELAVYFPAGIPDDPLTGQPLHYSPATDGSFTVSPPGAILSDPDDENIWKVPAPASPATPPVP